VIVETANDFISHQIPTGGPAHFIASSDFYRSSLQVYRNGALLTHGTSPNQYSYGDDEGKGFYLNTPLDSWESLYINYNRAAFAHALEDISDVKVNEPVDEDLFTYSALSNKWVNRPTLFKINGTLEEDEILVYDPAYSKFVNKPNSGGGDPKPQIFMMMGA